MKRLFNFLLLIPLVLSSCGPNKDKVPFKSVGRDLETYYNDSYFLGSSKEYSQEIALASLAFAMSTVEPDKVIETHGDQLYSLFENEHFSNIYLSSTIKEKPTLDSVGYGIGVKKIEDFNLIAITIRSGSYGAEWGSNITVGTSGNSKGFQDSSEIVLEGLKTYISENNIIGHTKIWISGYSRGAAITNLLAANMLNNISDEEFLSLINVNEEDIYAYCFESPLCAEISDEIAKSDLYKGIHCLNNFNDLITKIIPHDWGMRRYGQSYYYPDRLTDINFDKKVIKNVVTRYNFSPDAHNLPKYSIDNWKFYDPGDEDTKKDNLARESIHPSMGRFVTDLIKLMNETFITREIYSKAFEEGIREIIAAISGYNEKIGEVNLSGAILSDIFFSYSFAQSLFAELQAKNIGGFIEELEFFFYMIFDANKDNVDEINRLYNSIYYLILFLSPAFVIRKDLMMQFFSRDNLMQLLFPHTIEFIYPFLECADKRFYGNDACSFNDGTYQILNVKTPSSISIYENNLKETIFTYDGEKMKSDILSAEKLNDGSIKIYMPKNGSYTYEIESELISLSYVDEYGNEELVNESLENNGSL